MTGAAPDHQLPSELHLTPGSSRTIELPSGMGGGYTWQVSPLDPDAGSVADVRIVVTPPPPPAPPPAPPSSSQATEQLVVSAHAPGRARWRARQARSFAPSDAASEVVIEVIVEEG